MEHSGNEVLDDDDTNSKEECAISGADSGFMAPVGKREKPDSELSFDHLRSKKRFKEEECDNRKDGARFKGVWRRRCGRYTAKIREPSNKSRVRLGSFETAEEAARAYDAAAKEFHGAKAKAKLNFPIPPAEEKIGNIEMEKIIGTPEMLNMPASITERALVLIQDSAPCASLLPLINATELMNIQLMNTQLMESMNMWAEIFGNPEMKLRKMELMNRLFSQAEERIGNRDMKLMNVELMALFVPPAEEIIGNPVMVKIGNCNQSPSLRSIVTSWEDFVISWEGWEDLEMDPVQYRAPFNGDDYDDDGKFCGVSYCLIPCPYQHCLPSTRGG